jgi:hypothetical protein
MDEQNPTGSIGAPEQTVATDAVIGSVSTPDRLSDGDITSLREWGTDTTHKLPGRPLGPRFIGTSSDCAMRLIDPQVAPTHAQLTFDGTHWWIRSCKTAYDLRQDGVPRDRFMLTPGVEVGIGTTTLIAESSRTAQLRRFCQRLLGWGEDRMVAVDHALRAIRLTIARRSSLIIAGEGDLVPIAHLLHRHMVGDGTPFVVCSRRRRNSRPTARGPANLATGMDAFTAATGGSVCLLSMYLPSDADKVIARTHHPSSFVRLFVCMPSQHRSLVVTGTMPIQIPPLQVRELELPRIIDEYAEDAISTLGEPPSAFTEHDRCWVMMYAAQSHQAIEKATLRLVARRTSKNLHQAASRLRIAGVSLTRWFARRPSPDKARGTPVSIPLGATRLLAHGQLRSTDR